MASNEQGEEEFVEPIEESESLPDEEKINQLKTACMGYAYSIVLQVLVFTSTILLQLLTLVVLVLIEFLAPTIPTVTFSPFAVQIGGEGILVTRIVMAAAVGVAAKKLYRINTNGYPEIEITVEGEENG